jgi:hypothetical protein
MMHRAVYELRSRSHPPPAPLRQATSRGSETQEDTRRALLSHSRVGGGLGHCRRPRVPLWTAAAAPPPALPAVGHNTGRCEARQWRSGGAAPPEHITVDCHHAHVIHLCRARCLEGLAHTSDAVAAASNRSERGWQLAEEGAERAAPPRRPRPRRPRQRPRAAAPGLRSRDVSESGAVPRLASARSTHGHTRPGAQQAAAAGPCQQDEFARRDSPAAARTERPSSFGSWCFSTSAAALE